jgi:hypothetical protein
MSIIVEREREESMEKIDAARFADMFLVSDGDFKAEFFNRLSEKFAPSTLEKALIDTVKTGKLTENGRNVMEIIGGYSNIW